MRNKLPTLLVLLASCATALAGDVPGLTVEYLAAGTAPYVQAISAVGRITLTDGHATLVFKDEAAGSVDLGALTDINRITFGQVSESSLSAEVTPETALSVTVYPNPAADHVHVSGLPEGQTIRLFSQDGKALISTQEADINLAGLPAGVYILQSGSQAARIIKK